MQPRMIEYQPERDFLRVRDFLTRTYRAFPLPLNWGLERWNYARYFVAPMLGSFGTDHGTPTGSLDAIRLWERMVRLWENGAGEIVGVTCIEHPDPTHSQFGEIFVQRHPEHPELLDEMIAIGESLYMDPRRGRVHLWAFDADEALIRVLRARGFHRKEEPVAHLLECEIRDLPPPELPRGYHLLSMADVNDIDKRREIFGRSFNHEDPREWPSPFAYRELQRAPDYRKEYDLFIVAPDGGYAACCIVWHDKKNQIGYLEPLGTHPDHRRKGLANAILQEGLRRLWRDGARRMPMMGGFDPFYQAFGFIYRATQHPWVRGQ